MKALFVICKVLLIICTALFALLAIVDAKCIIFAIACLVIALLIKPTQMVQRYKARQDARGFKPQHQSAGSALKEAAEATARTKTQTKQRIADNKAAGVACCPKCGSTSLSANKKGFSFGKAAAGAFVAGPTGLVGGTIGANKIEVTCLNCGHKFKPGK